jgi:ABC-type multidrug transport system ATPase subunit/pSer/pThr/pTyr-binding forkhead associated (FHA) protein/ABC-type multidrug transport system permease subunit
MVRVAEADQPAAPAAGLDVKVGEQQITIQPGVPAVIGRDPGCRIRVPDPLVSRRHAELTYADGAWVLRDLGSSNGTYVDGQQVQTLRIAGGARVRLGGAGDDGLLVLLGTEAVPAAPIVVPVAQPEEAVATEKVAPDQTGTVKLGAQASSGDGLAEKPGTVKLGEEGSGGDGLAEKPGTVKLGGEGSGGDGLAEKPGTLKVGGNGSVPAQASGETPATTKVAPSQPSTAVAAQVVAAQHPVTGRVATAHHLASGLIRIGRDDVNDIVLDELSVSRKHAEVRPTATGFEVADLGSTNGTFVNGRQITRAPLNEGDHISIGRHRFVFENQRLQEFVDTGPVSLVADDLMVQIGDAVLLDDISFALPAASLLAVIGPSGCGKSTLLRAMTGLRPATTGRVRYDGRDLYDDYAELRYRIGLVPQDDVLHRQLTVRRALRFAAALRFADDVPRRERWARVDEVLRLLGLTSRSRQRIDTLSGGQRKRTSVALELLTEPSLLYLDEPTSGLDPALDKEVMTELREIADSGRTVVVVTHSVLHLDLCDRVLVLCQGGTMGYFGPPEGILEFFGAKDYAEVFTGITDDPKKWTRHYRGSDVYRRYVLDVMDEEPAGVGASPAAAAPAAAPTAALAPTAVPGGADGANAAGGRAAAKFAPGRASVPGGKTGRAELGELPIARRALHPAAPIRQFFTLCFRMIAVIASDRGYSLFLLGLPLALALITRTVPGHDGLAPPKTPFSLESQRLLVVLAVGAAFLGIATAIREIVNESTIYRRERAVGLSPTAYLASKVAVFLVIDTVQVVLFVYLSLLGLGKPASALVVGSPLLEIMISMALVAVASTSLGLLVSALVKTTEQTTPVLVVAVMAQLVLSGGLFELTGQAVLEQVSWLAPTRWGFAAGAATVNLEPIVGIKDHLWDHTVPSWWRAIVLLIVETVVLAAAARLALRRHEPGR